ncbi:MAG: hypothetical protein MR902_01835 [Campylobacter sp.]|nr:hypothetical protein [Campylobacter sp.]
MKALKYLFFVLIAICIIALGALAFVFSGAGNNIIKSYAQDIIKEKTGFNVEFYQFDLKFSDLNITAVVNDGITANVAGKYSIFSQSFDLVYGVNLADLSSFNLDLKEEMNFGGQIRGKLKNFAVNGKGDAFGSNITFLANITDFKPVDVDLDAKDIDISKVLAFLNMPNYIDGTIGAVVKVQNENGTAKIISKDAILNAAAFKEHSITLPANLSVSLNSDIVVENLVATATTTINSALANINAQKSVFDINTKAFESDFSVDISDLAKLEPLIKQKLSGSLNATGNLKFANNKLEFLNTDIAGFGGHILANLNDAKLKANLQDLELSSLIAVASIPSIASGKINGSVDIADIYNTEKIAGNATININNGKINEKNLSKFAKISLPKNTTFNLKSDTTIENGDVKLNANLSSNLLSVDKLVANYSLPTKNAKANFAATIPDIAKFATITNANLKGKISISGDASLLDNKLNSLNATINALDGVITASTNGKTLDANVKNIELLALFGMVAQPSLASGKINANIHLNSIEPKNLNGDMNLKITNGALIKSQMDKLTDKNFPNSVKFSADANVKITNSIANFTSLVNSDLANLSKLNGSFDINQGSLNSDFSVNVPNLSKLEFLTGRKLNGTIILDGKAIKDKDFKVNATSDFLGGSLVADLINADFSANLSGFNIKALTDFLGYDNFYNGTGSAKLNYNLTSQIGKFDAKIHEGRLTPNKLTNAVKLTTGRDLTGEVYKDATVDGTINKNKINFNANMSAPKSQIVVTDGKVDTLSKALNIPVSANIEKTDLDIVVAGTTENPKVNISSKYLEKKLDNAIDKGLKKIFGEDKTDTTNSTEVDNETQKTDKDVAKDILKGIGSFF